MKKLSPEVRILAGISAVLKGEYDDEENVWDGSPFAWIKGRPSRQIGAIGEKLVAGWLAARGFNVSRSPNSDADRVIEKKRVEIKFSTLWANGGYKFQQLRDQKYDFVICLGISPFDAHCWIIPKSEIIRLWKIEHLIPSQHGGVDGSDTAWIAVNPDSPPSWLSDYGGNLSEGVVRIGKLTGFAPSSIKEDLAKYDEG